jgi:hypothetical protein
MHTYKNRGDAAMYKWSLNGKHATITQWNGWTVALLGGAIGMLIAGMWWWLQGNTSTRPQQQQQRDWHRLGQAPSRSHIQLFSHPARQEQPR